MTDGGNGFSEYKRLIVETLERVDSNLDRVEGRLQKLEIKIEILKVHAGIFGAIAGAIFSGIVAFVARNA